MPVVGDPPPELRDALEEMERLVQSFKKNIGYVAPEMQDLHWGQFQQDLAEVLVKLNEESK